VYTFHAIRECLIKLNKTKYSRLNDDAKAGWLEGIFLIFRVDLNRNSCEYKRCSRFPVDTNFAKLEDVKFLFNQTAMNYEHLRKIMLRMTHKTELDSDFVDVCREYARLVGKDAVTHMLLLNADV